jgi:inosine-uridine nucleoside N-ribohydrolase
LTPINIAEQAPFTLETARSLASLDSAIGRYFEAAHVARVEKHPVTSLMYDQIAILALLEPDTVQRSEEMFLDVEVDHGAHYGQTLYWDSERRPPPGVRKARVLLDLDTPRFMEEFVERMKRPGRR